MSKVYIVENPKPSQEWAEHVVLEVADSMKTGIKQKICVFMTLPLRISIEHGSLDINVREES